MSLFSIFRLLPGVLVLLFAGCQNPSFVIEKEAKALDLLWRQRVDESVNRETRVLAWGEAMQLLEKNNPELQRATEELWRAHRGIGQVYRNLLPSMQLQASVSRRVTELDTLSFDDIRWDLNAYAFLSGFLTLRRDVFAAEITYIRSNLLREVVLREKVVELHRLFTLARRLKATQQRLAESERVLSGMPTSARSLESAPATVDLMREQLRSLQARLEGDLLKLLSMPEYRFELSDTGLPDIDYARTPLEAADSSRVGVLRRKLLAVDLVGVRARVTGAKLQYWPDVSLYLSSGPLWTTSQGQTIWWNADDLRLSASVYLPIDINGYIRNRVRDAKVEQAFLEREISLRESQLALEFSDRKESLSQTERELTELERKRRLLMQLISIEGTEHLGERLRQWVDIENRRDDALDRRAQLNAFFLFFDETFWKNSGASIPSIEGAGPDLHP